MCGELYCRHISAMQPLPPFPQLPPCRLLLPPNTHPPAISVLLCAAICTSFRPCPVSLLVARSSMSSTELGAGITPCGIVAGRAG